MGKALVIDGLNVTNPLCRVTLVKSPLEAALSQYYEANKSINGVEKNALDVFVGGLIEKGLWGKMEYFYPMLGSTIDDMLINVVSPSTDDFLANVSKNNLSVEDRVLMVADGNGTSISLGERFMSKVSNDNISLIACTTFDGDVASKMYKSIGVLTDGGNNNGVNLSDIRSGGYAYPELSISDGSTTSLLPPSNTEAGNQTSYKERVLCATYNKSLATLYKDDSVYSKESVAITPSNMTKSYKTFYSNIGHKAKQNFIAIGTYMTDNEWSEFYQLLLQFMKVIGKHS